MKGAYSEAAVTAALLRAGFNVLIPHLVSRYDIVIEGKDGFYRVQCKTAQLAGDSLKFSTKSKGRRYEGEIDYFGVYEPTSGGRASVLQTVVRGFESFLIDCDRFRSQRGARL